VRYIRRIGWLIAAVASASPAMAQSILLTGFGAAATNSEVEDTRQARGLGFGFGARAERSRFRVEARYLHAALRADFSIQQDYNLDQLDLAVTWFWRPYLAAQVGAARRFISPDLAAQDVGAVRLGVLSEIRLHRLAGLWVRGALLPVSRFSGGGSASMGLEVGLGVEIGDQVARFQGFASFDYQRLNRHTSAETPLHFSVGQAGVRYRP
jgi:hypothetical protein